MITSMKKVWVLGLLVLLFSGCSTVGVATPQTFEQKLAYGYSTLATIRVTTANAYNAGTLSKADAITVLTGTNDVRLGLDEAYALYLQKNQTTALDDLAKVLQILSTVQNFLNEKNAVTTATGS